MDNGQVVWVQRAKQRGIRGYRMVSVMDEPPRTAKATLAALTVLEGRPTDMKRLRAILPLLNPTDQESIEHSMSEAYKRLREQTGKKRSTFIGDLMAHRPLLYAQALLRYYRPDFDNLPPDQQRGLLEKCCDRINEVLDSVRLLADFLQNGGLDRDQRPAVENPHKYVEAAMLRDVEGLKHREIAGILRVDISEKSVVVDDYSAVVKMVGRRRDILRRAFGKDGWDEMVESMRAELSSHDG
jgi:hypothetical protein